MVYLGYAKIYVFFLYFLLLCIVGRRGSMALAVGVSDMLEMTGDMQNVTHDT